MLFLSKKVISNGIFSPETNLESYCTLAYAPLENLTSNEFFSDANPVSGDKLKSIVFIPGLIVFAISKIFSLLNK